MGYLGVKPCLFPMDPQLKLNNEDGDLLNDPNKYQHFIERLVYLTITRPNILFVIHFLSQFLSQPHKPHMDAAMQLLKYFKGTPGHEVLVFSDNKYSNAIGYYDSDWASCPMTH
jgi:hypothetical protein